jgi:hypothetical protein
MPGLSGLSNHNCDRKRVPCEPCEPLAFVIAAS